MDPRPCPDLPRKSDLTEESLLGKHCLIRWTEAQASTPVSLPNIASWPKPASEKNTGLMYGRPVQSYEARKCRQTFSMQFRNLEGVTDALGRISAGS